MYDINDNNSDSKLAWPKSTPPTQKNVSYGDVPSQERLLFHLLYNSGYNHHDNGIASVRPQYYGNETFYLPVNHLFTSYTMMRIIR